MDKSKFSYFVLITILIAELINLLVFFNIFPFTVWKLTNRSLIIFFFISLAKRNKEIKKNKTITILAFIFLFILFFTDILILIKFNF